MQQFQLIARQLRVYSGHVTTGCYPCGSLELCLCGSWDRTEDHRLQHIVVADIAYSHKFVTPAVLNEICR